MRKRSIFLFAALSLTTFVDAEDFEIEKGETVTIPQVLTDKGDKGEIERGGTLEIADSIAVDMQNDDQTLDNEGRILTTGDDAIGVRSTGSESKITSIGEIATTGDRAHGIQNFGSEAKIKNSGEIETTGDRAHGIQNFGTKVKIENSGQIVTAEIEAHGIQNNNTGAWAKIKNSGVITTEGLSSQGIQNFGPGAKIKNCGEIATTGFTSPGIINFGKGVEIKNCGEMTTTASSSVGIFNSGSGANIKNSGEISTIGMSSFGIQNLRPGVKIKNSGEISTLGLGANGIVNLGLGVEAKIKNSGEISTIGERAIGIQNSGSEAKIKNTSEITTAGDEAHGILTTGSGAKVENCGEIATKGDEAVGIQNFGSGANIKNCGEIETRGLEAVGIENFLTEVEIKNSGKISTAGNEAHGIHNFITGTGSKIKNSGKIETSGIDAHGILNLANNVHIINKGTIKSEQGSAIEFEGLNPTLTLERGSNLQGAVNVPDDDLNLNVEKGLNLDLTLAAGSSGYGSIDVEEPFVLDGLRIVAVDRTGFAMQTDFLADLSDSLLNGLFFCRKECSCQENSCSQYGWAKLVGSYRKRSDRGNTNGYRNKQGGFLFGLDTVFCQRTVGLFGGAIFGKTEVSRNTQDAWTRSYIAGLTYSQEYCCGCWGLAVAAGYVDWENKRYVMNNLENDGEETARAYLDGTVATAEVNYSRRFSVLDCCPKVGFSVRYAGLYFGDYKEKGVEAPLSVKERDIDLLTTRAEVAFPNDPSFIFCWDLEPYFGVFGRYQLRGNRIDAELLEESLNFDQGCKRNLAAIFLGLRGTECWNSRVLFFNMEASFDTARSTRLLGELGIQF